MKGFRSDLAARFTDRPNRFVVIAEAGGRTIRAHCPNPGRLLEILTPQREIILEDSLVTERASAVPAAGRKTRYTLVGAHYKGKVIPLYSGRAHAVAAELIIPELFSGTTGIVPEYTLGASRFDFLLKSSITDRYLEVKACTHCEEGTAMFPDAPTTRGLRHVREIASLSGGGTVSPGVGFVGDSAAEGSSEGGVLSADKPSGRKTEGDILFVIMHADAERFIPNIHTDPDFSLALYTHASKISLHAASVEADQEGKISLVSPSLPIDLSPARIAEENRGIYMLVTVLDESRVIHTGSIGALDFEAGFYVYVGSAKKNLTQRISRHLRKKKQLRWHIDYLIAESSKTTAFPVRTHKDLECDLAEDISNIAGRVVRGFGCSDCSCPSHLFYFSESPIRSHSFLEILQSYRHRRAFD